ncbi:MAG: hypothetical protein IPK16_20080 [Anaerolineales bacterium]|nr:hypothetical protein [Anaerolineales bacterium]
MVDLNQWPEGAAAGMVHLQAALWALRNIYRHDLLDHLAELAGVLAELTKVYGDVESAITVLHYVVTVRK